MKYFCAGVKEIDMVKLSWISNAGISCFIALHFVTLHECCAFYKWKQEALSTKKNYYSLYCATFFITEVWKPQCHWSMPYHLRCTLWNESPGYTDDYFFLRGLVVLFIWGYWKT